MSLLGFALESSGTPKGYNPLDRAGRNAILLTQLHCPTLFEELSPTLMGFQHTWGDVPRQSLRDLDLHPLEQLSSSLPIELKG